jgi:hypothetical protein
MARPAEVPSPIQIASHEAMARAAILATDAFAASAPGAVRICGEPPVFVSRW